MWVNLDYSPIAGDDGNAVGALAIVVDTTPWVYAERAQRESESRFRTLADNIAAFAWMADEAGNIFWYNKRWFDYTGLPFEEAKQWGWPQRQHPDQEGRAGPAHHPEAASRQPRHRQHGQRMHGRILARRAQPLDGPGIAHTMRRERPEGHRQQPDPGRERHIPIPRQLTLRHRCVSLPCA